MFGEDPLHHWAMGRRRAVPLRTGSAWVAPPEYVIVRKLEFFREGGSDKHLRGIRGMPAELGDAIDHEILATKIAGLGLEPQWVLVHAEQA